MIRILCHLIVFLFLSCSSVAVELLNLSEGSTCMRGNVTGKCVSIYNCISSYVDYENKNNAPICSIQGKEPILCCTDCTFLDTRDIFIDQQLGVIQKTGNKAQDKCLEHLHKLNYWCKQYYHTIMTRTYDPDRNCYEVNIDTWDTVPPLATGGSDAYRDQYPHMALLGYGDDVTAAQWHCGGSVISDRFILTAGHCLSSPMFGVLKYITLGILKRSDPLELWQIYNVKRRIPHPEYKSPSVYHDIALLETDTRIKFSKQVLPACLHAAGMIMRDYSKTIPTVSVATTGWGALGKNKGLADNLQTVLVKNYDEDECSMDYPPSRNMKHGYNHTTQMCQGDHDQIKDTCVGDSGGPLQYETNDYFELLSCMYTIIGVTSVGKRCGNSPGTGIYTRVIYYIPWIESVVWP